MEISIFSMMRPDVNHGTRDVSVAQTSREAIDVRFSALPAAEPSLRTDLTAPGQGSHCETYFLPQIILTFIAYEYFKANDVATLQLIKDCMKA